MLRKLVPMFNQNILIIHPNNNNNIITAAIQLIIIRQYNIKIRNIL